MGAKKDEAFDSFSDSVSVAALNTLGIKPNDPSQVVVDVIRDSSVDVSRSGLVNSTRRASYVFEADKKTARKRSESREWTWKETLEGWG